MVRYFVQPGYSHGFGDFDLSWDSLTALDAWVETGKLPDGQIATDDNAKTHGRQMPLCQYPDFPHYVSGAPTASASFQCHS